MNSADKKEIMRLEAFFEYSVAQFPHNIALVCDQQILTYQELELLANRLANYLLAQGLGKNHVIGILVERSIYSYVAILASLKIGAAYVPIEIDYPTDRVNYIFADISLNAVLMTASQASRADLVAPNPIIIDQLGDELARQSAERPKLACTEFAADDLCYVIYTSGSTGKPKGVEIAHQSICHYVRTASQIYHMSQNDKVYQGFSLAFDASLEEVWMAFANGATLIACTDKGTRSGIHLIEFLQHHQVTVFSTVPTLLATLEPNLPTLRLLILGGEVCPASLLARWHRPALRIINTYGPTEATVIATYQDYHVNRPVTIGKSLPGYELLVLDENLEPVVDDKEGELCISGICLARGYVNSPETTAAKFVEQSGQRLYRSGDLVQKTPEGEFQYLGRIDDQIKLRGFRIELNEIEQVMMKYPAVKQAVVSLQQLEQEILVAYLRIDDTAQFEKEQFKLFLNNKLPHYMIPSLFELVESFPLLPSGKVNRKQLPKPKQRLQAKEYIAPSTALEKEIVQVWQAEIKQERISVAADFFYDLGGHSLSAARIVSNLRKIPAMDSISILDLYQNPSIKQLAAKFSQAHYADRKETKASTEKDSKKYTPPAWMYYLCTLGQFFGVLFQCTVSAWQLLAVVICYTYATETHAFFSWYSLSIFAALFFIMPLVSLALTISMKWILLGRVKPGKYPLWGWFYLRWWLVERLQKNVFSPKHLIGSPLIIFYYRLLGAKIGKNCYIGSVYLATLDALNIGDNTSIGYDARLLGYVVEDGWLKIGKISIGNNCYIGSRSVVSIDTIIEDNAVLDDMSMLPIYRVIPAGQFFAGSPAKAIKAPINHIINQKQTYQFNPLKQFVYSILHYLCLVFVTIIHYGCFLPAIVLVTHFYESSSYLKTILLATVLGALTYLSIYFVSIFICKKLIIGKLKPGFYPLTSLYYLRQWTIVKLLDIDEIYSMADSLYFPILLRFLGANIGKRVEMGEAPHLIPDLVTIKEGGFTASAVALAWPMVYKGVINFAPIVIDERGFVGNMSLLPAGLQIGEDALLGCMSIAPHDNSAADANTAWLGSPAVFLPKRELFLGYSDRQTYRPSKRLFLTRLLIEFVRIIMPTTFSLIMLFNMLYALDFLLSNFSLLMTFLVLPILELGIIIGLVASLVGFKWLLHGRLKPAAKPIWDIFIWKNDLIEYTYSYFITPFFTNMILGTPFVSLLFRCLGAKVGKRVFIDTADFTEFDLIKIGHDVCINAEAIIQTHLYEDRIFKMSTIDIGNGCNIGVASVILYNTVMENNATLGNLSLLMKGERLPANTRWRGIPAQSERPALAEYQSIC